MQTAARIHPLLRMGLALIMLASLVGLTAPQTAEARPVKSDRSDNTFYFSYDATQGEITSAASSLQEPRRNPISQHIYVDAVPGAEVGRRLKATVKFKLNAKEKRRFKGSLTLEIRNGATQLVHLQVKEVDFVLRPKPGARRAKVVFRFDLDTGDYSAVSIFDAPPP